MKPGYRYALLFLTLIVAAMATCVGLLISTFDVYDEYAVGLASHLVIMHMDANDGAWPSDWNQLEDDWDALLGRDADDDHWEKLKRRVVIEFGADPAELTKTPMPTSGSPFRLIDSIDPEVDADSVNDANRRILSHLQKQAAAATQSSTATTKSIN